MNRNNIIRAILILLTALVMLLGGSRQITHADGPTPADQTAQPQVGTPPPGIFHTNGSSGGWG